MREQARSIGKRAKNKTKTSRKYRCRYDDAITRY